MNIEQWVEYIQTLHIREIDLTLDRVKLVYQRLRPNGVSYKVITVAGTNGKGSTCELLSSIYTSAGYTTGKYCSPHIEKYNERINISRLDVNDRDLLQIFQRVESARGSTRLTFFEFGTLVAIEVFAEKEVDVAIMEVGLGGRLDAVNILDADLSVITSVSIDHTNWLGNTRAEIGLEKIAVSRPNQPCVIGFTDVPTTVLDYCSENSVAVFQKNKHFNWSEDKSAANWKWESGEHSFLDLPLPFRQGDVQLDNASSALMVIELLNGCLPVSQSDVYLGLQLANIRARCEIVEQSPTVIVDVAHNQASINRLKKFVNALSVTGKVYALCGMLKDKKIKQSLLEISDVIDEWSLVTISNERGCSASDIHRVMSGGIESCEGDTSDAGVLNEASCDQPLEMTCFEDVQTAYDVTKSKLKKNDVLIVFGSFFIVNDIMSLLNK